MPGSKDCINFYIVIKIKYKQIKLFSLIGGCSIYTIKNESYQKVGFVCKGEFNVSLSWGKNDWNPNLGIHGWYGKRYARSIFQMPT